MAGRGEETGRRMKARDNNRIRERGKEEDYWLGGRTGK